MTDQEILVVEKRLGYTFRDRTLLVQAFTRTSYVNEKNRRDMESNQVLEFFGDSVLSCALVTLLARDFARRYEHGITSRFTEGDFSVMKSHLSDKTNLSKTTATLGFGPYLLMGEGDRKMGVEKEPSVLEDLYESIIGAVWLDSGNDMKVVTRVVENTLDIHAFAMDLVKPQQSFKNQLQEYCQDKKHRLPEPKYTTLGREGKEHAPTYIVECRVGTQVARGRGRNTQKAQTAAAEAMLALLKKHEGEKKAGDAPQRHPADTPASRLRRIADQRKITLSFTEPQKEGEDCQSDYVVFCTYGTLTTKGQGKSKSEAKQQAASHMLTILRM
ncbi:MAG: hypothetical protein IKC72_05680 [Clostridia bacterium]|nr:hypothetical protein [Clostridia bacterium]